ncbi:ligase-associated DNA damage response endonuclease PdeM [Aquamicrobium sp. LC103]|uniref:ligase-associated DNA damage response endonuclease PdeM n=1 Tax=Aquamicrobium sp. LC103 TaxID=1120658 RepID=UPI00063ECB17|nr:ligase-associated DNA damage response endonuclease PdeM [Aquamicrobium sp. LC103]TKT74238.1 ligase-associated DNA damage response endonuclease PdeM [Aquamicrobium sp. LC103]
MTIEAGRAQFRQGEIEIAGEVAVCDPRGVLYLPDWKLLAVSDLHLEKGSSYARRGQMLPPYDTGATLALLARVIGDHRPETVISLGDSFHDGGGAGRMPETYRQQLLALMAGRDWIWVAGNHDPDAPADLPGTTAAEVALGRLRFRHEPATGAEPGEIAGHLHPGAMIVRRGRAVRRRCFATDGERLVMPAFGAYTGTLNVLDRAYRRLFRWESFVAYMLGESRVYRMEHRVLRAG